MRNLLALIASVTLLAMPVHAATVDGKQTYDLLFKDGTLDDLKADTQLVYDRDVDNRLKPESGAHNTGKIKLRIAEDDASLLNLMFHQGEKFRRMGEFPVNVGNPMIMVFYESVVRDMAETAGGSPFYIRNRVKESLVQPSEVEEGEAVLNGKSVPTRTIRLYPFEGDPNKDRMKGFGEMELTVTMSEAVPGWYVSFAAEAMNEETGNLVYRAVTTLQGEEEVE